MGVTTRILILWLLSEGPLHGYKVQRALSASAFHFWFDIKEASIYAMLRSLVKQGFARVMGEERVDGRPPRRVYQITRNGRSELRRRMESAWLATDQRREPIAAALATEDELQPEESAWLLAERRNLLAGRLAELAQLTTALPSARLARREQALLQAEINWITEEIEGGGYP